MSRCWPCLLCSAELILRICHLIHPQLELTKGGTKGRGIRKQNERERAKQSKNNGSTVFVRKIHLGKQHLTMRNCYECLSLFKVYKYCLVVTQWKKCVILRALVNFSVSSRGKIKYICRSITNHKTSWTSCHN